MISAAPQLVENVPFLEQRCAVMQHGPSCMHGAGRGDCSVNHKKWNNIWITSNHSVNCDPFCRKGSAFALLSGGYRGINSAHSERRSLLPCIQHAGTNSGACPKGKTCPMCKYRITPHSLSAKLLAREFYWWDTNANQNLFQSDVREEHFSSEEWAHHLWRLQGVTCRAWKNSVH